MISPVSKQAIEYDLNLSGPTDNLPPGYLFLCPLAELQAEHRTCFRIPDCIGYWSLDPSGVGRLSDEAAEDLGFPVIKLDMCLWGRKWNANVYNGIRQLHKAKGFDPYSQEVALELGYPFVQLSCDREVLLARSKPRIYYLDSSVTLSQCKKTIQVIGTRTQMETLMQAMVLNLEMSNMVFLDLLHYEFYS
jgi:hypothetical protein